MSHTTVTLSSIVKHFESMPDPRHKINRRHLLGDVIAIAICGIIVGCEGPTTIAQWAHTETKSKWLKTVLELPNGIPSRDCIRRILTTLNPEVFQESFSEWVANLAGINAMAQRIIAIDGKTMRRSHDRSNGLGPLHMVSAWSTEIGLSLGQVATEEKSNEITAIPELIDRIDIKDAIVTIDAMGCQKKIAKRIVDSQADYVLAVKYNQPKLYNTIKELFSDEREDDLLQLQVRQHKTFGNGHGRKDDHCYVLVKIPDDFPMRDAWPGLKAIGMAVRVSRKSDGTTTCDARYYITSRFLSGKRFAEAVRGHWGIENSLHWVLDVSFNEDQSRTRKRFAASNLSWLRRFAISLLKRHSSKHSIVGKSRICGWDDDFLMQVLTNKGG